MELQYLNCPNGLFRPPYKFLKLLNLALDLTKSEQHHQQPQRTMICRTCLRQATGLVTRPIVSSRTFSVALRARNAAAPSATAADLEAITPNKATSLENEAKPALSSCPEGTVLTGLNYFKGKPDLVAKADDAYPEWLWRCLEVQQKSGDDADAGAGDEFCTSPHPARSSRSLVCTARVVLTRRHEQPSPRSSVDSR